MGYPYAQNQRGIYKAYFICFFSFSLHLLVFVGWAQLTSLKAFQWPPARTDIEKSFDLTYTELETKLMLSARGKKAENSLPKTQRPLRLSALGLAPSLLAKIHTSTTNMAQGRGVTHKGEITHLGLGKLLGAREENQRRNLLDQMYQKIFNKLDYPQDVAKDKKEGMVVVEFWANLQGEMIGDYINVSAEDRILKVLALRSLRPLKQKRSLITVEEVLKTDKEKKIRIKSVFRFFISSRYQGSNLVEKENEGSTFYFYKSATDTRVFSAPSLGDNSGKAMGRNFDPRTPVKTTYDVFDNGILQLQSDQASTKHQGMGTGSVGVGINYVKLIDWLLSSSQENENHKYQEEFKNDPDY